MLRGVSVNAPKKFTMVRKIHRENDHTSIDPSLSGNKAPGPYIIYWCGFFLSVLKIDTIVIMLCLFTTVFINTNVRIDIVKVLLMLHNIYSVRHKFRHPC